MIQKISKNFIGTMSKFLTHKASQKLYETKIQIFQLTTISKNCDSTVSLSSSLSLRVTNGKIFSKNTNHLRNYKYIVQDKIAKH